MTIEQTIRLLEQAKRDLPVLVGNEMVNFAQDNILAESFDGRGWPARRANAPRNEGRGLLRDTGTGFRSIQFKRRGRYVYLQAIIYMVAHNEGARIAGTFQVRAHQRTRRGRTESVRAHTRTVNFRLPKRTFAAYSPRLDRRIGTALELYLKKRL